MPIYEFVCSKCESHFDHLARSMGDAKAKCPKCGSEKTTRALSVFAVADGGAKSTPAPTGGCGRCGGPGPCGME
jgi:putative FmdB family regulatory protein